MASNSWQRLIPDLKSRHLDIHPKRRRKGFRPGLEALEARTLLSGMFATPGKDGTPGSPLAGVVNTYYAGTTSVAAGSTSLQLGTARGSSTTITAGDLLLVVQVQNASINSSNSSSYGDGSGSGSGSLSTTAGTYEYVEATDSVGTAGGTLTFVGTGGSGGLVHAYQSASATVAQGQETYEIVRVPQYVNVMLGSTLTAASWDGSTGGILAVDVAGNLDLNSATVSVDGEGFRGGAGRQLTGGTGSAQDFASSSAVNDHGSKGEGIAGTPEWVYDLTTGTAVNTGQAFDGLPGGSAARGAPGNAGGGGTDADPTANDQNTGGGGGANGGVGGQGGYSWATAKDLGGKGGALFPATPGQLVLGGGGGAGARNNSTGFASSGGTGGGIVLVRAGSVSGTGTISANGVKGITPSNDGGGGGGAGGSVEVLVDAGVLSGLTIQAAGAAGTDAWPAGGPGSAPPPSSNSNFHGPGGGGGGGVIVLSSAAGNVDVSGGANGTTTTSQNAYGAVPGDPGIVILGAVDSQIDGKLGGCEDVADVAVTSSAPSMVHSGGTLTYTLTVTNNGPEDAANVSLTDALPAGLTLLGQTQVSGPAFTLSAAGNQVSDTLANLASGASAVIQVQAQAAGGLTQGAVLSDTANVTTTALDQNQANNSSTVQTTVDLGADLGVAVSAPATVDSGSQITETITVTNNGPDDAQNVTWTDPFPSGTTFVSQSQVSGPAFTLGTTAGQVQDTITSLASGQSATFHVIFNVSAAPGATLSNTAAVGSTTDDPNSANNSAAARTLVNPRADLSVQVAGPANPVAGANAAYTVTVANNGPSDAQNVVLSDDVPAGTTLLSQAQTSGPAFVLGTNNGKPDDTIGILASGQSATFQIVVAVPSSTPAGSTLTDGAVVSSSTTDPDTTNNSAQTQATVGVSADLAVGVTGPSNPVAGTTVSYTVTVVNKGPSDAQGVLLTDALPGGGMLVSQTQTGGPAFTLGTNDGNPNDSINTLASGQTATFQVLVAIPASTPAGRTLVNEADVSSTTTDPVLGNNTAQVQGSTNTAADLAISVSGPANAIAGTNAAYLISVVNNGPSDAQNVALSDALPAGATLISQTQTSGPSFNFATSNGNPNDSLASLASGQSATFQVVASIAPNTAAGSILTDSGSVNSTTTDPDQSNNTAKAQTSVVASADLAVTVAGPANLVAGTNATYTLTVTNNGPSDAQSVNLLDTVPAGTTLVSQTQTSGPNFILGTNNGNVSDGIGTLASGQTVTIQVVVAVPSNTPTGATLTDNATVGSATNDPVSSNNSAPTQGQVGVGADLAVRITGPSNPVAGANATYTLTVSNNGPSDAQNVQLTDALPGGTVLVSQTQTGGPTCTLGTNNSAPDDTLATLTAGQSATFQVVVAIPASTPAGTPLTNSATVSSGTTDPNLANNTAQVQAPVTASADLAVSINGPTNPVAGTNTTYTLTVVNYGPSDAQSVVLADALPSGTTLVSQSQTGGPVFTLGTNSGNPSDTIGTLASGQSATFQIVVAVHADTLDGTILTNTANISSATPDPDGTNNTAQTRAASVAVADLAVTVNGPSNPVAGTNLTYTVSVANNGPSDAQSVVLSDVLPPGTTLVSQTQTGGPAFALGTNNGNPNDTIAVLARGTTATFQVVILVPPCGCAGPTLTDTAQVSSTTTDPNTTNNTAQTQAPLDMEADLAVSVAGPSNPVAGSNATYTVTVTDNGPSDGYNVVLGDVLPAGTSLVSQTQTSGPAFTLGTSNGNLNDTLGRIVTGETATFQVVVAIPTNARAGLVLTDSASISSDTSDPDPTNNTAMAQASISASADLAVSVTGPGLPVAGTNVTYTVTVTNNGPADSQNVLWTDALPAGATLVSQTQTGGPAFTLGTNNGAPSDTIGSLASGQSATFQIVAALSSSTPAGSILTDAARVTSGTPDPITTNNTAQVQATVAASADVAVTVSGPANPIAGTSVTYTLTVVNKGPSDAQSVVLSDALPAGTTLLSQAQTAGPAFTLGSVNGTPNDTIGTLGSGQSATFQVIVQVPSSTPAGHTLTDSASVSSVTTDPNMANNSGQTQATVATSADLAVAIIGPTNPVAGRNATYTVTVSNNGPSDAQAVLLDDLLPNGVTLVSQAQTSGPTFTLGSRNGNPHETTGALISGQNASFQIVVSVPASMASGTTLTDSASVSSATTDPVLANNNAQTQAVVAAGADLAVTVVGPSNPVAGSPATYTVNVVNNGPSDAQNVTLTDNLPSGTTLVTQTQLSGATFTLGTNQGNPSATINTLASGQGATFQITVAVPASTPAGSTLTDRASVGSATSDPNLANNSAQAQATVATNADLAVSVTGPANPVAGSTATYTLTVVNNGPSDAQNVVLSDLLPTGATLVSQTQSNGPGFVLGSNHGSPSDTANTLASGQTATIQVVVAIPASTPAGTQLVDGASVHSTTADPNAANNSAQVQAPVSVSADLAVHIAGPASTIAGSPATYTLTVTNNGPSDAQNVSLQDLLPTGWTLVSQNQANGPSFHLANTGGLIDDTVATLASGASATIQVVARVDPGTPSNTSVTDAATVSSSVTDPVPSNNSDSTTTTVATQASLKILETVDDPTPNVGDVVNFTVVLTNSGPSTATAVVAQDLLPPGLVLVNQTAGPGTEYDGTTGIWSVGTLAPGSSAVLHLEAAVVGPDAETVTATVRHSEPFDPASSSVLVTPQQAELSVTQTVNDPTPSEGEVLVFNVDLQNNGPHDATHVTLQDLLPAGATLLGASTQDGTYDATTGTWDLGTVQNGGQAKLVLEARVDGPTPFTNAATVAHADQFDPILADNSANLAIRVRGSSPSNSGNTNSSNAPTPGASNASATGGGGGSALQLQSLWTSPSTTPPGWGGVGASGGGSAGVSGGGGAFLSGGSGAPAAVDSLSGQNAFGAGAGASSGPMLANERSASISGLVYHDSFGRGSTNPGGSEGLANVPVVLSGSNDRGEHVMLTTSTDEDGFYSFTALRPGNYSVALAPREGALPGKEIVGTINGNRVGERASEGAIERISLPAGSDGIRYNLGQVFPASVSGFVFEDDNRNGVRENGERGLAGIKVTLLGTDDRGQPVQRETRTDADGAYGFRDLRPGNYAVQAADVDGFQENEAQVGSVGGTATKPSRIHDIPLPSGAEGTQYNFGKVSAQDPIRTQGSVPRRRVGSSEVRLDWEPVFEAIDAYFLNARGRDSLSGMRNELAPSGGERVLGESWSQSLQDEHTEENLAPAKAAVAFVGVAALTVGTANWQERRQGRSTAASMRRTSRPRLRESTGVPLPAGGD